jgi:hypothetical protein
MSLPMTVIDRLFQRMAATYGASWDRSMGNAPLADVKTAWAHELQGFGARLDAVAWALENLPERCPNVIEFRNLCRKAPEPETPKLPEPPADPERLRAELAKLQPIIDAAKRAVTVDRLAWARRIVSRRDAGARVAHGTYNIAADALRKNGQGERA